MDGAGGGTEFLCVFIDFNALMQGFLFVFFKRNLFDVIVRISRFDGIDDPIDLIVI